MSDKGATLTGTHMVGGRNRVEILASCLTVDGKPIPSTLKLVVLPVDENGLPK